MFKQTLRLFIKALIIGILLSVSLQQVSGEPLSAEESLESEQSQHLLDQPSLNPVSPFPAQAGN